MTWIYGTLLPRGLVFLARKMRELELALTSSPSALRLIFNNSEMSPGQSQISSMLVDSALPPMTSFRMGWDILKCVPLTH